MKAAKCSDEAAKELRQLCALESQAEQTAQDMMGTLSAVVPVCKEEVETARSSAAAACKAGFFKFEEAIDRAISAQSTSRTNNNSYGPVDKRRKGLLSDETKAVLMDWLEKHYDEPYPTEEEKMRLVKITGTALKQVPTTTKP